MTSSPRRIESVARQYWHAAPWTTLDDGDLMSFRDPPRGLVACASVFGGARIQFGGSLYLGEAGLAQASRMSAGKMHPDELAGADLVSLTFERKLTRDTRDSPWLLPAFKDQGKRITPMFWWKPPYRGAEVPDEKLVTFACDVFEAIPRLIATGQVSSIRGRADRPMPVFLFPPGADGVFARGPDVDGVAICKQAAAAAAPPPAALAERIRLRKPRGVLAVTLPLLPGSTKDGDAGRCLLVVSPDTGRILEGRVFPGVTAATDAASRVLSLLAGTANPPPREPVPAPEVLLTDMHDLHDALAPALAGSGVQIDFHEHIPELAETSERFMGHLRQRAEEKRRGPEGGR